ncbi:solute carrier family 15 member 2 isoform X1 [Echinops telfairi]|uniref:Solute carrier family 15 member 2 isoform X1 n=1 Tax=Echinops telfairi TaxID=9371 RepID=A0ABM0J0S0_ECHTE|nr:solute carrier family 15 member 2 isoform X1 [Echinops telfairi]
MNSFQKKESKRTLFSPVSFEEAPSRPPSPPKKPPRKICGTNYPLSIAFIVVNEFCERFSYYGMKAVLTLYFLYYLHWHEDTATSVYHAFSSLCYFTPLLGAAIADSWLGKFKTIVYLSLVYVLGHVIKSLGAIPMLGEQSLHRVLAVIGLSLIALGTGGIKPCVAAFGGDQFEEKHANERTRYFSVFYLSINAGSLISTFVTPMLRGDVQCFGDDCYALAFGIPGLLMVIALVVFIMGSKMYIKPPPKGNILAQVIKCVWFAISNRFKSRSRAIPRRQHWLDWAAEKYPKQLIMDVKALTRVLFLYIPLPMFWALLDQQGSRWTLQATKMDGNLGFFVLQPDQMQVLNPLLVLVFIPVFDFGIYRLVSKCGIHFSSIRKMVVGMLLACLAFAVAAVIEIKIYEMVPSQMGPQEVFLQVLNVADNEVKVTGLAANKSLLEKSIKPFQKTPHHFKLQLNAKKQDLHFLLEYQNFSVYTEHFLEEKNWYSLILHGNGENVSSVMVKNVGNKTTATTVRFVNTLQTDINISLGKDTIISVGEAFGVSPSRAVERGEYPTVYCRTKDEDFYLNLGRLDFGEAYLFVITNKTRQGPQAWEMEDMTTSKMSIAWQLPQYALVTAGEVMFSVTGLEFSYSQAPSSMKSVLQAAWLLTVAVGNVIVLTVAQFSGLAQWAEFILFSCLLLVVCLLFSIMGYYYVPANPEETQGPENKQLSHIQGNMINLKTKKTKL